MKILTRVVGTTVEWQNPRTGRWDPISSWGSVAAAEATKRFFDTQTFRGW